MLKSELIIFDCDGVLGRYRAFDQSGPRTMRLVRLAGKSTRRIRLLTSKAETSTIFLIDVEAKLGKKLPELMDEYRRQMYIEIHELGVPALGGIHELLDALDAMGDRAPHRCIGTNAPLEKARLTLGGSGLIRSVWAS